MSWAIQCTLKTFEWNCIITNSHSSIGLACFKQCIEISINMELCYRGESIEAQEEHVERQGCIEYLGQDS